MNNGDVSFRLKELNDEMSKLVIEVNKLRKSVGENEVWDNADLIRNWKISTRTLASWRAEGLIGYVQIGGKILYPREMRENFLKNNIKNGENKNGI
ncbi:hypothetical protein AQPE_2001 [Aquipluma nitroreducens]|uniref:Helix-turn-helix domain-containing protein n=1 Tax=Aquipluma nitroreducens TaxID=2010828 RepID=A0A5K7S8G1_9BACT|nr:hypothetical protein [Aquipluma nitroreducens]BBE17842.1 hypothetical protein AQPE_2001 [Aquipluma nitroreducens]